MSKQDPKRFSPHTHTPGKQPKVTFEKIDTRKIVLPAEMTPAQLREHYILQRIGINLRNTGHPFHHKTMDGTVIDTDPSLEDAIARLTDAAPTVPVDRWHYGSRPVVSTAERVAEDVARQFTEEMDRKEEDE